jgi:hypothetical protein
MANPAFDGYEQYYAEKLWSMIPAYYRDLDGENAPPGTLRALVEVISEQAAVLRRSQDRVWEDQFVERADDWAIAYLGDLVATRMVAALLPRAQRVDVAKTVYYRRRAGTLRVLEELISDIPDWEGVVREGFRRLARAPHGLDPTPNAASSGAWSGTPPGALPDLRDPLGAELLGGAFDEYHHTPDLRRPRGRDGRYGISRLVFHLYRIPALLLEGVTPRSFSPIGGDPFYTFDPSGRDVPLFIRRTRSQAAAAATSRTSIFHVESGTSAWEGWTSAKPWQVPSPLRCRLLGDAVYELDADALAPVYAGLGAAQRAALSGLYGLRVRGETRLRTLLATTTPSLLFVHADIRELCLVADCGKAVLLGATPSLRLLPVGSGAALAVQQLAADELSDPAVTFAPWQLAAIDAERGRFVFEPGLAVDQPLTDYHYGFAAALGAGVYERNAVPWHDPAWFASLPLPAALVSGGGVVPAAPSDGVLEITDNLTYQGAVDNVAVRELSLRSTEGRRPYVLLDADWQFTADVAGNAILLLEGLWLGAAGAPRELVLSGDFERVELRCCSLDPGGIAADGSALPRVGIRIDGSVELLVVESSIIADITVSAGAVLGALRISRSIMQAATPLMLESAELHLTQTTVFNEIQGFRLWASNSLIGSRVSVVDVQNGCFRFSAAQEASLEQVPHPHRSVFFADEGPLFVSRRFGSPGYALLSEAPEAALTPGADSSDDRASIHSGADNEGEMGAYNALLFPVKRRALSAKVEEFLPFGLLPVFVNET